MVQIGAGLPDFVEEEFDAFLECGTLAHGFILTTLSAIYERVLQRLLFEE